MSGCCDKRRKGKTATADGFRAGSIVYAKDLMEPYSCISASLNCVLTKKINSVLTITRDHTDRLRTTLYLPIENVL